MEIIRRFEPLFGDWYAESLVGVGSFGRVYKAYREEFGERYYSAIKYISIPADEYEVTSLRDDGMDDESITTYYTALAKDVAAETRLMSKLKGYSNIVSYEDSRVVPKANGFGYDVFIRMELLESLSERTRKVSLSQDDVISLGIDICTALEVCGEHGIIHRDIKPDNIFINSHGDYKLGDFGIARQLEKTATFMSKKGSYNYMAPEVYKGEKYCATCDIYSLGLVMYRLLNKNRLPFFPEHPLQITPADKEKALLDRLSGKPMSKPCNADESIAEIIRTACAFDPEDRFGSPKAMKDALVQFKYKLPNEAVAFKETVVDNTPPHSDEPTDIEDDSLEYDATSGVFGNHAITFNTSEQNLDDKDNTKSAFETSTRNSHISIGNTHNPSKARPVPGSHETLATAGDTIVLGEYYNYIAPGETLFFGEYYQTCNHEVVKAPIEWLVLEKNENKILILSKYALDCQPYEKKYSSLGITWLNCSLRTWLNTFFLESAFTVSERDCILQTSISIDFKQGNAFNGQQNA
ncbi:MAG: serine/threonine protein kinase, partial [Clostridia bacterium]|nr:serine/threonine protein kinase [Clostridia bacterium]